MKGGQFFSQTHKFLGSTMCLKTHRGKHHNILKDFRFIYAKRDREGSFLITNKQMSLL